MTTNVGSGVSTSLKSLISRTLRANFCQTGVVSQAFRTDSMLVRAVDPTKGISPFYFWIANRGEPRADVRMWKERRIMISHKLET